jgi:hypothetical protein
MEKHTAKTALDHAKRALAKLLPVDKLAKLDDVDDLPAHACNGSVASFIFYLQFALSCGDWSFAGKGGGLSSPGGGALFGTLFANLDDLPRVVSFEFNCTPVYTSLLFFDGDSNLVGHFQSGSVSTVLGVGGGSGSWAKS